MSKVDDSDAQRIREMQEAELRNRVDQQKKDTDKRVSKAFSDVMRDKASKEQGQRVGKSQQQQESEKKNAQEKSVLNSLLKKSPKEAAELSRRAALSHAVQGGLSKSRTKDADETNRAQSSRVEDMTSKDHDEKDIRDKDLRETNDTDDRRSEEREADVKQTRVEQELKGELARADADGHRRNSGGDGGGRDDDRNQQRAKAIEGAQQPKAAHVPRISQELIDQIVSAIHTAHMADGRTEMQVDLKGSMLDGIRLKVHAQNGKVRCTFEGCDKQMKALLEGSKGALMRGLSKKGMTLVSLDVK
jgi:hypothetical protein